MRPISLSIKGLRSYRDNVDIDFRRLCEAGLFGIVGPTGSGKSTVLDAIFLALFNEVPRGSVAGDFVHLDAPNASLDLVFEVTRGGERRRWRVRREWRRTRSRQTGELSTDATSQLAQLFSEGPNGVQTLHAHGPNGVSKAIETEVLGIRKADFEMAVVLPQGKFDQLLRATANDRAELMARIFGFDRFKGPLQANVKAHLGKLNDRKLELDTELRTLEVSPEALVEAREAARLARERQVHATNAVAVAEVVERRASEAEALRLRQVAAKAALARVEAAEADITASRHTLDRSDRAALAAGPLQVAELAHKRRAEREQSLAVAKTRQEHRIEELAEADRRLTCASQLLEAEAPSLNQAILVARQAVHDSDEAERLRLALAERARALAAVQATLRNVAQQAAAAVRTFEVAHAATLEQERVLQGLQATPAERASIAQRAGAARDLERAEADREVADEQLKNAQSTLAATAAAATKAEAALQAAKVALAAAEASPALGVDLDGLAEQERGMVEALSAARQREGVLASAEQRLATAERALEAATRDAATAEQAAHQAAVEASAATAAQLKARDAVATMDAAVRAAERHSAAALLARGLHSGDPCPVCGSAEHPALAAGDIDVGGLEKARATAQKELVNADKHATVAATSAARAQALAEGARSRMASASRDVSAAAGECANHRDAADTASGVNWSGSPEARALELRKLEGKLGELSAHLSTSKQAAKLARTELERAAQAVANADRQAAAALEARAQRSQGVEAAEAARTVAHAARETRHAAFISVAGGLTRTEVAQHEKELAARDQRAEAVQKKLEETRRQALAAQSSSDRLRDEEAAAQRQVAVEQAAVQDHQRLYEERRAAVVAAIGDVEPRSHLVTAERRLESLKEELEKSTRVQASARVDAEVAATSAASSQEQLEEAARDAEKARLELDRALVAQGFATTAEVSAALLPETERNRLRATIADHDHARAIAVDAVMRVDAEVLAEVAARGPLPEPGFASQAQAELALARAAADSAREAVGQTSKALEVLEAKAELGAAVAVRLEALKPRLARAERMSALVRGGGLAAYAADRYLARVLTEATANLRMLSKGRYSLLKADSAGFLVRDHFQAEMIRAASTLSGGESFLASLALALALSDQIQHRGSVRFDFFFMDEGFGSLDAETLDVAIEALERLRGRSRVIGTISHVPQLHERLPRRLVVERAPVGGSARVRYEEG